MEILGLDHLGIVSHRGAAAADFYQNKLGFTLTRHEVMQSLRMTRFEMEKGDIRIEILEPEEKSTVKPGLKHIGILVPDAEAAYAACIASGIPLLQKEVMKHGGMRFFFARGPSGEFVEFIERV